MSKEKSPAGTINIEEVLSQMTLEEKAQMCSGRDFWKTQDIERLGIPSVMMCDGPNGLRKQLGKGDHLGINAGIETVCYPTASAAASSFDKDMMRELGEALGEECQAENVGMLLGPGINMKRSPLCGRNFEYYSEDPYLAGQMAAAYIKGLQSQGVAACVKHFAANNQETRRMSGSSQVDERTLHEIYLPAFETAVKEGGTRGIMCAYNAVNGTFCAENKQLLTDILRDDWGYKGFVVTDWGAVKDRVKGLKAGLDLEMPGSTEGKTASIVSAVESGELEECVLDAAVRNVLKFVKDAVESRQEDAFVDREEMHGRSVRFAEECAVLLKNDCHVLPLKKEQKVAFIGAFAEEPRYQGAGSSHINVKHPVSAMECTEGLNVVFERGYLPDAEETDEDRAAEEKLLEQAVRTAASADAAVIFAGLPDAYESEGFDRDHMRMPQNQNRLIMEIAKVQKNTVVVLHGGASIQLPWREEVAAILMMHLSGDGVGRAAVDLLYGKTNPSGKLAETWPLKIEDNPSYLNFPGEEGIVEYREGIFIGYRYYDKKAMEVQYPFGHGLSYTTFAYSELKVEKEAMSDTDTLHVTVRVKNTGDCFGKEAVQIYTSVADSKVRRPVRELKGFEKVALNPGEEKEVEFLLDGRSFAYYEPKIHGWFVESGKVLIEAGASSRDIRLSAEVRIDSAMELPMTVTRFTTMGELMNSKKGREFMTGFMAKMGMGGSASEDEGAKEQVEKNRQTDEAMGAGAERMRMQMMFDMPLSALVSYGIMTEEALDGIIEGLNH